MPFNTDIRAGTVKVEFNISVIHEIVGSYLDEDWDYYEYWDSIDLYKGTKFWFYVCELENEYSGYVNTLRNTPDLYDWLVDNYNNIRSWEDVIEDVEKVPRQLHEYDMEDVFKDIVEKPKKKKLIIKKKLNIKKRPTWEEQIGFPTGIYNSYKEMVYAEYGEQSEQALDLEKSFREAVELNK